MEKLDKKDAELDILRQIITYLTDTLSVARELINTNNNSSDNTNDDRE